MNPAVLPEIIETARLTLRPPGFEDVEDVLSYAADEEWARYQGDLIPTPYERRNAVEFLARQVLVDRSVNPVWALVLQGTAIGGVDVRFDFKNRLAEIGFSVAKRSWGQGLATEAVSAVIDAVFRTHTDLNRIRAVADLRNIGSLRVLGKIGMSREGVLRQNRVVRGELVDEIWYGLLRPEWIASAVTNDAG